MSALLQWLSAHGPLALFALVTAGVNIPIPAHAVLSYAGVLACNGELDLLAALGAASAGSCLGVTISYLLGSVVGTPLLRRRAGLLGCSPERVERLRHWLRHRGRWALMFGFFLPGVRNLVGPAAGTLKLRFASFAPFAYAGGVLWAVTWVIAGYWLGKEWLSLTAMHVILLVTLCISAAGTLVCLTLRQLRGGHRKRQ